MSAGTGVTHSEYNASQDEPGALPPDLDPAGARGARAGLRAARLRAGGAPGPAAAGRVARRARRLGRDPPGRRALPGRARRGRAGRACAAARPARLGPGRARRAFAGRRAARRRRRRGRLGRARARRSRASQPASCCSSTWRDATTPAHASASRCPAPSGCCSPACSARPAAPTRSSRAVGFAPSPSMRSSIAPRAPGASRRRREIRTRVITSAELPGAAARTRSPSNGPAPRSRTTRRA